MVKGGHKYTALSSSALIFPPRSVRFALAMPKGIFQSLNAKRENGPFKTITSLDNSNANGGLNTFRLHDTP